MRISARIASIILFSLLLSICLKTPVYAQTDQQPSQNTSQTTNNAVKYLLPNADENVPVNHHSYTQILLIDGLSSIMCIMTGIDPSDPNQPCLGVDPNTGKIGLATPPSSQFGQAQSPQVGGALGLVAQSIGTMYIPAVTGEQYFGYLADNFGIVKPTYAAEQQLTNCNTQNFGYGFCGLSPIFTLWADVRDLAYALLTILFIVIGVGVMLRFRVDPRTVMTLQNQIPRVVIAIFLITFSYAIAGIMIDLMWTVTYTGIDYISNASPNSLVQTDCNKPNQLPTPLNQAVEQRLIDQPLSFTNTVLSGTCAGQNGGLIKNGLLSLSTEVSGSLGDLVTTLIHDLLFSGSGCHVSWWEAVLVIPLIGEGIKCALGSVALNIFLWITEILVKLIVLIAILVALFRLWFKLIQTYLTFLIFVILGPLWIVLGLIPGRPMGFEKWFRIVFSNLAVFPVVAFLLVFARVIKDAVPHVNPQTVFVPPLIGNQNISTFSDLMAFGAILLAPTIPDLIKERMKATGQAKYGAAIGAGIGVGAAAFSAPGRKVWEGLNRVDPNTGQAIGSLAVAKQRVWQRTPFGRRAVARRAGSGALMRGEPGGFKGAFDATNKRLKPSQEAKTARQEARAERRQERQGARETRRQENPVNPSKPSRTGRVRNWFRNRGNSGTNNNGENGAGGSRQSGTGGTILPSYGSYRSPKVEPSSGALPENPTLPGYPKTTASKPSKSRRFRLFGKGERTSETAATSETPEPPRVKGLRKLFRTRKGKDKPPKNEKKK